MIDSTSFSSSPRRIRHWILMHNIHPLFIPFPQAGRPATSGWLGMQRSGGVTPRGRDEGECHGRGLNDEQEQDDGGASRARRRLNARARAGASPPDPKRSGRQYDTPTSFRCIQCAALSTSQCALWVGWVVLGDPVSVLGFTFITFGRGSTGLV